MLRRFKGGATVACDVSGCKSTFRSFSRASLVRGQASVDGWTHREPTKLERDAVRSGEPIVHDRCPACSKPLESTVSIAAAAEPEKLVSRDSVKLTTETTSLVIGQPASPDEGAETVGGDRLSSTSYDRNAWPAPIIAQSERVDAERASVESTAPRKRRARRVEPVVVEPVPRKVRPRAAMPGTLALVVEILREARAVLSVREIVERAGDRLPSKSKTPSTVVSRDLALAVKHGGDASIFVRVSPGRFALRELAVSGSEVAA